MGSAVAANAVVAALGATQDIMTTATASRS
jgi:hypothetical protein